MFKYCLFDIVKLNVLLSIYVIAECVLASFYIVLESFIFLCNRSHVILFVIILISNVFICCLKD